MSDNTKVFWLSPDEVAELKERVRKAHELFLQNMQRNPPAPGEFVPATYNAHDELVGLLSDLDQTPGTQPHFMRVAVERVIGHIALAQEYLDALDVDTQHIKDQLGWPIETPPGIVE